MNTHNIPESPRKVQNEERFGNHSNSCIVCGKPTNESTFIHATTDWVAIDEFDDSKVPNSQGLFPIGPKCLKLFPKEFIIYK